MFLGGLLLSTVLGCDVSIVQDPFSIDIESASVCRFNPKGMKKAMSSSVEISFIQGGVEVGGGSGNYFKHKGNTFVLTAAHVADMNQKVEVFVNESVGIDKSKVKIVYINHEYDIAILKLERELTTVDPIKWKRKDYWQLKVGEPLYYTGNPLGIERLSIRGNIAKIYNDLVVMQGFAYDGASGSAVFDKRGNVVGVVSAIPVDLFMGQYPQKIADLVFVAILPMLQDDELSHLLEGQDE